MNKYIKKLFSPLSINELEIPNRIVMAPMTRSKSPNSTPGEDVALYYKRRAENGVGLIITEGTTVDTPNSSDDINIPSFHGEEPLAGWKNVVENVHEVGGLIFPQIWHQGTLRRAETTWNSDFPSWGPSEPLMSDRAPHLAAQRAPYPTQQLLAPKPAQPLVQPSQPSDTDI